MFWNYSTQQMMFITISYVGEQSEVLPKLIHKKKFKLINYQVVIYIFKGELGLYYSDTLESEEPDFHYPQVTAL